MDPCLAIEQARPGKEASKEQSEDDRDRAEDHAQQPLLIAQDLSEPSEESTEGHEDDREAEHEGDRPKQRAGLAPLRLRGAGRSGGAAEERQIPRNEGEHAGRGERDKAGDEGDRDGEQHRSLGHRR